MGTAYDTIIDLSLVSIEDYRLNDIARKSPQKFATIMDGFLMRGLFNFDNCVKDLSDRDDVARKFNCALNDMEIGILADYTAIAWLDKEINDVRQITGMLENNKEAHRYSEANNLTAKTNRRIELEEDVARKKTVYGLKNTPWKKWAGNDYEL